MLTPFQNRAYRALLESPFFAGFDEDCMRWVHRTSVRRGETLFEKGAPSDAIYGLVSGQLKQFSEGNDGRQISFGIVGPGELVGAVGLTAAATRHASVAALSNSELATLKRRDLEPLLERRPALREALAAASAETSRQLAQRIEDAAFLTIDERVEKAVVDFARRFGERTEVGTCVKLRQQDLAEVLGLSRESVSKALLSPALKHRIQIGRGRFVLLGG